MRVRSGQVRSGRGEGRECGGGGCVLRALDRRGEFEGRVRGVVWRGTSVRSGTKLWGMRRMGLKECVYVSVCCETRGGVNAVDVDTGSVWSE